MIKGSSWSLLVLRDVIFSDRRYFRALLTGSIEGIATNILADRLVRLVDAGILTRGTAAEAARSLQPDGSRHPDSPDHLRPRQLGLDWRPGSVELRSRQQLMHDEGPAFIANSWTSSAFATPAPRRGRTTARARSSDSASPSGSAKRAAALTDARAARILCANTGCNTARLSIACTNLRVNCHRCRRPPDLAQHNVRALFCDCPNVDALPARAHAQ